MSSCPTITLKIEDPKGLARCVAETMQRTSLRDVLPRKTWAAPVYDWRGIATMLSSDDGSMPEPPPKHCNCRCIVSRNEWDSQAFYDWAASLDADAETIQGHATEVIQAFARAFEVSPQTIGVFHEEKSMYYPEDYYEISERLRAGNERSTVHIDIKDIFALPYALRRLAAMGYDMAPSLEALQDACEEQRKRKALEDAIRDMTKPAEKAK